MCIRDRVPVQEDTRALTLADLACTLLSILLAILVWLRGKKDGGEDANDEDEQVDEDVEEDEPRGYAVQKTVNAVLAVDVYKRQVSLGRISRVWKVNRSVKAAGWPGMVFWAGSAMVHA